MNDSANVQSAELRKAVHRAISRAVARGRIPDEVIENVVGRLSDVHQKFPIRGVDVCVYGICIDHFVEPAELPSLVDQVVGTSPFRKLEVFPWGIPLDLLL